MTWRDAVRFAWSSLRGGLVRTLLTILGLGVGVGAVLAVLTLGQFGEEQVEKEIARLGVDKVWIRPKDAQHHLAADSGTLLYSVTHMPACAGAYTVSAVRTDSTIALTQIAGYDASMEQVHAPQLLDGRLFSVADFEKGNPVCLVDQAFAERLKPYFVGEWISVGNRRFRVIGVVKGMMMQPMASGSGLVILPLNAYLDTFVGEIAEVTLSVQRGQAAGRVAQTALSALSADDGFRADTLEEEIDAAREVVRIFVMVLICVAIVCMLTGSIGVMNVLLVSVRERRREIGLLKAIGGTSVQVGLLFLLEAAGYALLGGALGILLGAVMIAAFSGWIGLDASLSMANILPVMAGAAMLGIIFGVAPALKAAALQPVDALRCE